MNVEVGEKEAASRNALLPSIRAGHCAMACRPVRTGRRFGLEAKPPDLQLLAVGETGKHTSLDAATHRWLSSTPWPEGTPRGVPGRSRERPPFVVVLLNFGMQPEKEKEIYDKTSRKGA